MSGGSFDYNYCQLDVYAGKLEDFELNDMLEDFQNLLHDLEWYKSGDTDEEDYRKTVKEFKEKWFGKTSEERAKIVIDDQIKSLKRKLYECFGIPEEK